MACALTVLGIYAKEIRTVVFTTEPQMTCVNCENKIKGNLRFEKGVKDIETNLGDQEVVVTYDADKTTVEALQKGMLKIGYRALVKGGRASEAASQQLVTAPASGRKGAACDSTTVKAATFEAAGYCESSARKLTKADTLGKARAARQAAEAGKKTCEKTGKACTRNAGECTDPAKVCDTKVCDKGEACCKNKKK